MDFFGIGPLELVLILLVFFIFVGPAKLPEIAGMIGKGMRKFREASAELNKGLKEMADEVKEAGQEVGGEVDKTVKPQTGLTDDLREISREIQGTVKEAKDSAKSATRPARSSTTRSARAASKGAGDKPKQAGAATDPEKKETAGDQTAKEDG